jgi:murein DD-endopeptidase MepM/ murein hydrolase activator NlpD
MPVLALSTWNARRKAILAATAIAVLAAVIVVGNPLAGKAKAATVVPIVFPLEIKVKFSDTYGAPRVGHTHQGNDLMCPKMTKELAAVSGTVTIPTPGTYAGAPAYSLWLAGDDGHGYYYIHINNDTPGTDDGKGGLANAYAPGLKTGDHVTQGQFIAYAGDSGNAEGTGSHLHFEMHTTTSRSSPSFDPYFSLVAAPVFGSPVTPPGPTVPRYEQTDSNILYTGNWTVFTTSGASGGSYKYAAAPAKVLIWFTGTKLDLIATKGTTQGKASVTLDGVDKGLIDFSSATTQRQQKVWTTDTVTSGLHRAEISWTGQKGVAGGARINIDAVEVTGGSLSPVKLTTVEENGEGVTYANPALWKQLMGPNYSKGNALYANAAGASVTIKFSGPYLLWLTKTASVYGIAKVTVDGGTPRMVDLYSATTKYKQPVWNTGMLADKAHTVVIEWTGTKNAKATKTNIGIDAVQVIPSAT